MDIMKLVTLYEARTGETVDDAARDCMEAFAERGKQFTEQGREDAGQGLPALPNEEFASFGVQAFGDTQTAVKIAAIMQAYYMEGYKAASGIASEISR